MRSSQFKFHVIKNGKITTKIASQFAFAEGSPMAKLFTGLPRNNCPLMRVLDFFGNWLKKKNQLPNNQQLCLQLAFMPIAGKFANCF